MEMFAALFSDYTFQTVALGAALLGSLSAVLGCFAVLQKQSLLGDGVSHAALPGVAAAFLLTGSKNTEILLAGAFVSGLISTYLISSIVKYSRIKFDTALAVVMSVFFGAGLVLLTYVQKIPNANQAGIHRFIFGQASALLQRDVVVISFCGLILLLIVFLFWKEFKLFTFDKEYGRSIGFSPDKLNILLSLMIVMGIVIGLQTVGVILMSAMLIAPATAARQWCNKLWTMILLSAFFGILSGLAGTAASSLIPKMPTGPAIVVFASLITLVSLLFAPNRGILHKIYTRFRNKAVLKIEGSNSNVSAD